MAEKLSESSKRLLLSIARSSITSKVRHQIVSFDTDYSNSPELNQRGGVFVTLHSKGQLRGCIGLLESSLPLAESVHEMSLQSAFHDPRFPPLDEHELKALEVEISILTPPQPINDPSEIKLGTDGIIFTWKGCRSLFLPQVATEQGWDLETTLKFLSAKAGLGSNAWKHPDSCFQVFQAEHFRESEMEMQPS